MVDETAVYEAAANMEVNIMDNVVVDKKYFLWCKNGVIDVLGFVGRDMIEDFGFHWNKIEAFFLLKEENLLPLRENL